MTKYITRFAAPVFALAAIAAFASPVLAQKPSKENADADQVFMVETADQRMNAAIAEARATMPEWLALLADPPAGYSDFSFKFPLEGVEHIWVSNPVRDGDFLVGRLSNAPRAAGWALGDRVRVPISDISDWGYWDERNVAHGYRTMVVLFEQMSPSQVAEIRRNFGWDD